MLFRAMKAGTDGKPICGETKRHLGACIPGDVNADVEGTVHPRTGGMSVTAANPRALPNHRRPPEWGGKGRDPVFSIEQANLGEDLDARPEASGSDHWFVEPARVMIAENYQRAIWTTRPAWDKVTP